MPAHHPCTRQTTGVCTDASNGMSRCACDGNRRWMLPTRGRCSPLPAAFRATMSKPLQKWSPAPDSTMTRTDSSRPAASTASIILATMSSVSALRFSGRSSRSRRTPSVRSTSSPSISLRYRFPGGSPTPPSSEAWGPCPTPSVPPSAKRAEIASRARCRSCAPSGGSGNRTGPCSRLGSRTVA